MKIFLTREDSIELGIWAGILSAIAGTIINLIILALFGNIAIEMMLSMIENMNVEMPAEFQTLIDEALISKLTFLMLLLVSLQIFLLILFFDSWRANWLECF